MTDPSRILTINNLTRAIQNSVNPSGIDKGEARKMAEHMMNFFGYSDRIIDNVLEPEDRDVFYMMEDVGILMTEREETTLYDGREWRINYWLFRKDRIQELIDNRPTRSKISDEEESSVYEEIPDDVWTRD
ncbi:MAG: hypothetical protein KAJ51_10030 [Thermoplasmata archaeon]|nr:hypothetical protein [Thermoplasmata archaeon]